MGQMGLGWEVGWDWLTQRQVGKGGAWRKPTHAQGEPANSTKKDQSQDMNPKTSLLLWDNNHCTTVLPTHRTPLASYPQTRNHLVCLNQTTMYVLTSTSGSVWFPFDLSVNIICRASHSSGHKHNAFLFFSETLFHDTADTQTHTHTQW